MRKQGFTLLEVVLAVSITAFIALVAVAGFRTVVSNREIISKAADCSDVLRYCSRRIEQDLAGVVRNNNVVFELIGPGDEDNSSVRLRFHIYSTEKARTDGIESDRYEIEYSQLKTEDQVYFVRRICPVVGNETDSFLTAGGVMAILSENIAHFDVQCYSGLEWTSEWLTTTTLPELVKITLYTPLDASKWKQARMEQKEEDQQALSLTDFQSRTIWIAFARQSELSSDALEGEGQEESASSSEGGASEE